MHEHLNSMAWCAWNPCAGAYFAKQGVAYVNVCGLTVRGQRDVDEAGKPVSHCGRMCMGARA